MCPLSSRRPRRSRRRSLHSPRRPPATTRNPSCRTNYPSGVQLVPTQPAKDQNFRIYSTAPKQMDRRNPLPRRQLRKRPPPRKMPPRRALRHRPRTPKSPSLSTRSPRDPRRLPATNCRNRTRKNQTRLCFHFQLVLPAPTGLCLMWFPRETSWTRFNRRRFPMGLAIY